MIVRSKTATATIFYCINFVDSTMKIKFEQATMIRVFQNFDFVWTV